MKTNISKFLIFVSYFNLLAQNNSIDFNKFLPIVNFTAQEAHNNMMLQLGITETRPGKSGNNLSSNSANYDETLANPCPSLPDILSSLKGEKVISSQIWWNERRPELIDLFEREIYGIIPENVPDVNWEVKIVDNEWVNRIPVIAKKIIGHVDNSEYPLIDVNIEMILVVPTNVNGPVPVLIMFGNPSFPAPSQPNSKDLERLNATFKEMMISFDPEIIEIFNKYPAYQPISRLENSRFSSKPTNGDSPGYEQLLAAGWGYAIISTNSIQPDSGSELTKGIIGLTNHGQPRTPEQWGALRAWGWGASKALDFLESDSLVDSKKVGIEGVSRFGKAALVTLAFDQRFAVGLIGSSGKGGVTLHRRFYGETVENLAGPGAHHWMAGNYIKYSAEKSKFGRMTACDLPVDSHELIALAAPRLTFISYGIPEKGDAHWLDQKGSYMATVAAGSVFKLLGVKDLGVSNDYINEQMPPVLTGLLEGELAWRQHDGGHTDLLNFEYFIPWANKKLNYKKK